MKTWMMCVAIGSALLGAGCNTVPAGAEGPGRHYAVSRSHNGFGGTQDLRFGAYRVAMAFDASNLAKANVKRGLLGAVLGCSSPGCGMPRAPQAMPLDFDFSGPAGSQGGRCAPANGELACTLGDVQLTFQSVLGGFGAWQAQTPFGPLRVESRDIENELGRRIEWRVFDRNEAVLALVEDTLQPGEERDPSFTVWMADAHPDDHQALAKVVATLLAYAWHTSG